MTIRDLTTYEVVRRVRLPFNIYTDDETPDVEQVECRSSDGELAYIQAVYDQPETPEGTLMRVRNGQKKVLFEGNIRVSAIGTEYMYILTGYYGRKLGRVSLTTGAYEKLAKARTNAIALSVGPDEDYVTFVYPGDCSDGWTPAEVYLFELATGVMKRSTLTTNCSVFAETFPVDANSIVVLASGNLVFNRDLEVIGELDFGDLYASGIDVTEDYLYAVNDTHLLRAELPDGDGVEFRRLPGYGSSSIEVVP